jgi:hypothetical protein
MFAKAKSLSPNLEIPISGHAYTGISPPLASSSFSAKICKVCKLCNFHLSLNRRGAEKALELSSSIIQWVINPESVRIHLATQQQHLINAVSLYGP